MLKSRRRTLHADYAAVIEGVFAERLQDAYGMLAYHYSRADILEKAEIYLLKAGEEAADAAASAEALHFFQEAYRVYLRLHGDDAEDEKKAMLEKNIALALLNTGNLSESIDHFNAALRLYGEWVPHTPAALWLKLARDMSGVLFHLYASSPDRRAGAGRPQRHDMFSCLYNRCRAQNPTDPERNFFDNIAAMRHLSHVDPSTVDRASGMYSSTGAFFAFAGLSFATGRRFFDVASRLIRHDRPLDRFQHAAMSSVHDFHSGAWGGEHDIDGELLDAGLRAGLLWDADIYLGMVCERDIYRGAFADAERWLLKLGELSRDYGYEFARSNELAMTAMLAFQKRELGRAREAMQAYHESRHEDTLRLFALGGAIRVEVLDGKLDAAKEMLARAEKIARRAGRVPPFYMGSYLNGRLAYDTAVLERSPGRAAARNASRSARRARAVARKIARDAPEAARLTARIHWLRGGSARAYTWWSKAIAESERLGAMPELARTCADIGLAMREDGRDRFTSRGADEWLQRARTIFTEIGLDGEVTALEERCDQQNRSRSAA
jgi:tetratricopeptide (TPR) repeat protein